MSYENFNKALDLAKKCEYYTTGTGVDDAQIKDAESMLNIKFSVQWKEFYSNLNYLSFYGNEIYGINPNDLSYFVGNSVSYTLSEREENKLPEQWLIVYNYGDGSLACVNYGVLNDKGEPSIIRTECFTDEGYVILETVAEDFGDFLLQLVNECSEE